MTAWPDVEGAMKDYLKTQVTGANQHVFLGVPNGVWEAPNMFPLLTVQRVGGGQDAGEAPIDLALIQIDVWGKLPTEGAGKSQCWAVVGEVRDVLDAIRGATLIRSDVWAHGAIVNNISYAPDAADGRPRYVITTQVVATAA